jgi:peptide chain release factor 2
VIEKKIAEPEFWEDPESTQPILKRRRLLQNTLDMADACQVSLEDLAALIELQDEGEDVASEIKGELKKLTLELERTEIQTLLSGEHDASSAILTIHPGAGGTESQDWAEMLMRMYLRWAEEHGYRIEVTDYQSGDEAGVKSVTFLVEGDLAYGYLSAEIGVHRLVRISPFDAGARRHTSFASVFVTPEIEDDVEIEVDEKDLRIDTYRSSGAGGQHVNVTDSAVRITHLPTGVVVQCQNERSQHRNKDTAMKILRSKLFELEMEKRREELQDVENKKAEIGWGSQIRSYVLHPYRMVKDHRTLMEKGNVDPILDGDLDEFILAYLKEKSRKKHQAESEQHGQS